MILAQKQNIDQWNKIKDLTMSNLKLNHLIFNKDAKNQMMLGKQDVHMQKNQIKLMSITLYKN